MSTLASISMSGIATGIIVLLILCIALLLLMAAAWWVIFQKAGHPGWAAIIPIYNSYIQLKVANMSGMYLVAIVVLCLCLFIPVLNIIAAIAIAVINIMMLCRIGAAFNKGTGFKVGMIFLPFFFLPALAFGSHKYQMLPPTQCNVA